MAVAGDATQGPETQVNAGGRPRLFTRAVVGITVLNLIFFSLYLLYFPTLPFFIEKLGGDKGEIGALIGVSSLTSLLVRPFVGYLVDTAGRRPMLIAGMLLFAVNCLLYNLPHSPAAIFPIRLLTGASIATFMTAASTYIADAAPAARRGEAMAYYGVANSMAFAIGPAVGGFVIHTDLLAGFDSSLTSQAGWSSGARTGELHFTALFVLSAAMASLAAAGALLFLPPGRKPPADGRLPRAGALFSRTAALPAVINFTSSFAFAAMVSFLPLFARDRGITNPGLLFSLYAAMLLIFRLLSGRLMDTLPRHYFITPGIAALAVSLLIVASPGPSFLLFVAMGVYGVGTGAFQPAMMAYLVDRTEETVRGRALSTFTLGNDLGLSLGSFILGAIIQAADYRAAYIFGAAVAAAGAAIFALYNAREMRTAAARAN
ncbi:hypothetical protein DCC78_05090 [bacterium]|nr:MAG: hypothetical protein DCC78_05090 [bacterium]